VTVISAVIGSGCAQTWPVSRIIAIRRLPEYLLRKACRILLGLGMGPKASTVPVRSPKARRSDPFISYVQVFTAANTPASIRGGLVISWKLRVDILSLPIEPDLTGLLRPPSASWPFTKSGELHGGCSRIRVSPLMCGVYLYPGMSSILHRVWSLIHASLSKNLHDGL
jgi:hypothetical protein